ncbi:MAG: HAD-IG family 5'-nucleotidase [Bacteroidota bacterium]
MSTATRRGLYCNRTLNLRRIRAVGYDMDYTLIHYHVAAWEGRAYHHVQQRLVERGWPVAHLKFDPALVTPGLIVDTELGNVVKANRFGYVKKAFHGTQALAYDEQRRAYARTLIDLDNSRWRFLNTLFSISEAGLYLQLVDLLDNGDLDSVEGGSLGYGALYRFVRRAIDEAHLEGVLKAEIIANPDQFVDRDPDVALTLLDQKNAGKKLLLITNSEVSYAVPMLRYAIDLHLPGDMTWRDLFDVAIMAARKPDFFASSTPAYEVVDVERGLLQENVGLLAEGKLYVGGNAGLVERSLGLSGEEILYVGDHIFADVRVSKSRLRWRTALVLRSLADEIEALNEFDTRQAALADMMANKEQLEADFSALRLEHQRNRNGYGPQTRRALEDLQADMANLRGRLVALDSEIAPLAHSSSTLVNPNWGPLMRAGKEKSHLARQVERDADIYMTRVSDFLAYTPFVYLRAHRGSLPHDSDAAAKAEVDELR